MNCPQCGVELVPHGDRQADALLWRCRTCEGAAVNLSVLRRMLAADLTKRFWHAMQRGAPTQRDCPSCTRPLRVFQIALDDERVDLDVCKLCQLIWFDAGELARLPRRPGPDDDLSPEARARLAEIRAAEVLNRGGLQTEGEADRAATWLENAWVVVGLLLRVALRI